MTEVKKILEKNFPFRKQAVIDKAAKELSDLMDKVKMAEPIPHNLPASAWKKDKKNE